MNIRVLALLWDDVQYLHPRGVARDLDGICVGSSQIYTLSRLCTLNNWINADGVTLLGLRLRRAHSTCANGLLGPSF